MKGRYLIALTLTLLATTLVALAAEAEVPGANNLPAMFADDFSNGIDPQRWTMVSNQPSFECDDSQGDVHFSKPQGGDEPYEYVRLCAYPDILGDFDVSVEFSDAEIEAIGGEGGNIVGLQLAFGEQLFFLSRNGEAVSSGVAGVWVDPPGIWPDSWHTIPETATSGTLRVTRQDDTVSGYCNDTLVYEMTANGEQVTHLCLELANNWSLDPVSVRFDNFSLIADAYSPVREIGRFTGSEVVEGDHFGRKIAISGDLLAVAAPQDPYDYAGSVYMFERDNAAPAGWREVTRIVGPYWKRYSQFGYSIALSGEILVVGTPWACRSSSSTGLCETGGVFIYERNHGGPNNWGLARIIIATGFDDRFGNSVALIGDTLAVGAPRHNNYRGTVFIYERELDGQSNWVEAALLSSDDGAYFDSFGGSIAMSGNRLVISATRDDDACPGNPDCDSGTAYVFERDQQGSVDWEQVAKLRPFDSHEGQRFGWGGVRIDGDTVFVSSMRSGAAHSDAAYPFHRNIVGRWIEEARIDWPTGIRVAAVKGNRSLAVAGAHYEFLIRVLDRNTAGDTIWDWSASLSPRDDIGGGASVFDGERYLVGAEGTAYVFKVVETYDPALSPDDNLAGE